MRTPPEKENGSNIDMRTQSQTDDEVSLNASNLWFVNNANEPQDITGSMMIVKMLTLKIINQHSMNVKRTLLGPERSSCIAGASKIFWNL